MQKIEINFDTSFDRGSIIPIPIGRLVVGAHYSVRLLFCPDGKMKMVIPQEAIDKGAVLIAPGFNENTLLGLDAPKG